MNIPAIHCLQHACRFGLVFALLLLSPIAAAAGSVTDIRVWHAPERSRVVLDISAKPSYNYFFLGNPDRLVIDFDNLKIAANAPTASDGGPYISTFRLGKPKPGVSRLVLDLRTQVKPKVSYLPPGSGFKHRLIIDVYPKNQRSSAPAIAKTTKTPNQNSGPAIIGKPPKKDDIVIAIDAGHGGEDSGARGRRSHEKTIVLTVAKALKHLIDSTPGMRAELTRKGDYYIPLRKRTRLARQLGADLFISIHADGFKRSSARGSSVFALSRTGATSETARWLANKENAADLAGGLNIADKDQEVASVLLDLSMTNTINESTKFAQEVLAEMKRIGKVHSKNVEKAGFVVLKSPDIPSILVETAFITNPQEEKLLNSHAHQQNLAHAILAGVNRYVKKSGQQFVRND